MRAVAAGSDLDPFSVLDQLTLLAEQVARWPTTARATRYRLLNGASVRAGLGDSGEADVHARHRDYYGADRLTQHSCGQRSPTACRPGWGRIDNLRRTFAWSRENGHITEGTLASSLQPIWFGRAHLRERLCPGSTRSLEGKRFHRLAVSTTVRAPERSLTEQCQYLAGHQSGRRHRRIAPAQQALAMAREWRRPRAALVRALTACGCLASGYNAEAAAPYFAKRPTWHALLTTNGRCVKSSTGRGWDLHIRVTNAF